MDMTEQKHGLRKLMNARAPDSSLRDVARALFGLYRDVARDCAWPLLPADKLDAARCAHHLTRAFGVPVNDVRPVSISQPYADASWTTDEGFVALMDEGLSQGLALSLDDGFGRSFWSRVQLSTERRLITGIGERRLEILERDMQARVVPGLRQAMFATFAGPFPVQRVEECVLGVEETLRAFLAFTIMDDRADGVPYGHLSRLLLHSMVLGAKRGEPGTWLVAVA